MSNILLELKADRDKLGEQLEALNKSIEYYENKERINANNQTISNNISFKYRKGDTLKNTTINFVNDGIKRFSTINQISEQLIEYFPDKKTDLQSFKSQISSILSIAKKEHKVASYNTGSSKKNIVWGNLKWIDSNGNVIKGYECIDKNGNVLEQYKAI